MSTILFAPHADDECLFAFYTMLRTEAHVHVLLDSVPSRRAEFEAAMKIVRRSWTYTEMWEGEPGWKTIAAEMDIEARTSDLVIGPAYEDGGHEHHNAVAQIVDSLDHPNVIRYVTYRRGFGRTMTANEVKGSAAEEELKLRALLCYESQINDPATHPWFPGGEYHTLSEWIA